MYSALDENILPNTPVHQILTTTSEIVLTLPHEAWLNAVLTQSIKGTDLRYLKYIFLCCWLKKILQLSRNFKVTLLCFVLKVIYTLKWKTIHVTYKQSHWLISYVVSYVCIIWALTCRENLSVCFYPEIHFNEDQVRQLLI